MKRTRTKQMPMSPEIEIILSIFILGCGVAGVFILDAILSAFRVPVW